jgi:phosphoribosyl 1,2-cyclic phosphodiesterase
VKQLVLFHHDPSHHDDMLDELVAEAKAKGAVAGVEVVGAHEGLEIAI